MSSTNQPEKLFQREERTWEIAFNLDELHTLATSLGYSIENLIREEEQAKSDHARRYKAICREDLEAQLSRINQLIRNG